MHEHIDIATPSLKSDTVTDALASLFAELHLPTGGAAETDLVIDELDQWKNPGGFRAWWCAQTFNLVVVAQEKAAQ